MRINQGAASTGALTTFSHDLIDALAARVAEVDS